MFDRRKNLKITDKMNPSLVLESLCYVSPSQQFEHEARNERVQTVQATGWQACVLWTTNSMEEHSAVSHHGGLHRPGRFCLW